MWSMGFLRQAFGVDSHASFVISQVGQVIIRSENVGLIDESCRANIWNLWEWFGEYQLHQRKISAETLVDIYRMLKRSPTNPTFMYQKDDMETLRQVDLLEREVKSIFRPHLAVAFLPSSFNSNIWPLTGKPINNVEIEDGFGESFSTQLFTLFEKFDFSHTKESEMAFVAFMIAEAFTDTLKITNQFDRKRRIGIRTSAWELLPFIPSSLLQRHLP